MIDEETKTAVRDAALRVLEGRETVPGDLPMPPLLRSYVLGIAWPDRDPEREQYSKTGRALARAVTQVYIAGFQAGRGCDEQIGRQVRRALGYREGDPHAHVGVAACLVCDRAPEDPIHR